MNSFAGFSQKPKKTINPSANFLETLKDFGSSFKQQAKGTTFGVGTGALDQLFGAGNSQNVPQTKEIKPNAPFNFEEFLHSREKQIASVERQRFKHHLQEEKLVYHRKQEEVKLQIKVVQEELKKFASATVGLSQEIKQATLMAVVDPGTYHENFFDRLKKLIVLARKKICESKTWLETFNHRSKQKSFYWSGVQKSGTKFLLSHERYMATQAG